MTPTGCSWIYARRGDIASVRKSESAYKTPPDTPPAFASAVLRAEGFDPDMEKEQYRRVLEFVEQAFQRSTSDT